MTPFEVLYEKSPKTIQTFTTEFSSLEVVDTELLTREEILTQLKHNSMKAQKKMKHQAYEHKRDLTFQVGDLVMVKLHPYKKHSLSQRLNSKLCHKYYGPYLVIHRIG